MLKCGYNTILWLFLGSSCIAAFTFCSKEQRGHCFGWLPRKASRVTVKNPATPKTAVVDLARFFKPPNTLGIHQYFFILLGTICGGLFPNMFFWDKLVTLKIWERKTSIFQVQIWFWFHGKFNLDWRHQIWLFDTIWSPRNSEENCQICLFFVNHGFESFVKGISVEECYDICFNQISRFLTQECPTKTIWANYSSIIPTPDLRGFSGDLPYSSTL